jgi:hypothetical protein
MKIIAIIGAASLGLLAIAATMLSSRISQREEEEHED